MKGVTRLPPNSRRRQAVSIHTPNEGSDVRFKDIWKGLRVFQSTLPMKGVTLCVRLRDQADVVSIHTPNEGSDFVKRVEPPA